MIRALFGGSFDPFHEGHLAVIEVLRERDLCDMVHVVPAWRSPFKGMTSASAKHRLAMIRLAVDEFPDVRVEEVELRRQGASYTVETLRTLKARHGQDSWRLVVGADSYDELSRWREPAEILDLARPVVLSRRGAQNPDVASEAIVIEDFDVPVSSTDVRRLLLSGTLDGVRVPEAVSAYIRKHGLYGLPGSTHTEGSSCP